MSQKIKDFGLLTQDFGLWTKTMASNPVNGNGGINANVNLGGGILKADVNIGGGAKVLNNHGENNAIQNVNENLARNPNHAPTVGQNQDTANDKTTPNTQTNTNDHTAPPRQQPIDVQEPAGGQDGIHVQQNNRGGGNGALNASETGLLNGRGHHKVGHQIPGQQTPPIVILPNQQGNGNTRNGGVQTPPIIFFPNGQGNNPNGNLPTMGVNFSLSLNLLAHGNQSYGVIRNVVTQVLRDNDIYVSRNTINRLISPQTLNNPAKNLPHEINSLVQNVSRQVLSILNTSGQNNKLIHQISKDISHQIRNNIQEAKQAFLKNTDFGAVRFEHLNVKEKMHVAVELLPNHLPAKALESIQNHKANEVLNALLLARGLVSANELPAEVRNLVMLKSSVLPSEVSITALRDVGQLVKVLINDTSAAKTTANLDLAVQKFVKILLANNELGVLLATVSLASQAQNQGGLVSRSLALAQIYELINRMIAAGEKALRDASNTSQTALQKDRNIFQSAGLAVVDETDDAQLQLNRQSVSEAAGSLRQFLEFNPAAAFDNSTSAFNNPDDARHAQKDFINLNHDDIAAWLESGNHRLVKDFDFDKPVGVVVERAADGIFNATTARFVLVRDGSVQGWHFLKTFLVK